jgi:uncharacterized linocin/CFP29 family protein
MKSLRYVGKDEPLISEQGYYLLQSAIKIARRDFVGRKLLPIRFIDPATSTFGYDTLTEMSAARIDPKYPGKETLDITNLTRTPVNIPTLHKEFEIPKADLDASRMTGVPLNTQYSDAATYQVGLLEDTMLITGTTTQGTVINGLYNGAGNSESTNLGWGTAANIITSINNTIALLGTDHIYKPYNLVISPAEEGAASVLIGSGPSTYLDWILKRIGGQIFVSEAMTAGLGLMMKANPVGLFEYVVAEDLSVKTEQENLRAGEGMFGKVYVRGLPVIYDSNALCKMTDIGGS